MSSAVSDEISYMHRYDECMRREKVYGQKWLKLIYGFSGGSSSLGCHQKSLVFQLVWAKDEPTGKPREISGFIREFDLDESEFASPANTLLPSMSSFHEN